MPRIGDFRELRAYQAAYAAAMEIFEISKGFPDHERFGLTSQIRRSSRSVPANLVEAWRKRRYPAAFVAKLIDADAEAAETRVHLDLAFGCGYIDAATHETLDERYDHLTRQLMRMALSPERWMPGPGGASRRPAGAARVSPTSPGRAEAAGEKDGARKGSPAANLAQLRRKKPATPASPPKPAAP